MQPNAKSEMDKPSLLKQYWPLILIFLYIIITATIVNIDVKGTFWHGWLNDFMAGFFLIFSAFKFLDLKGFATGYATYDLLAARWKFYGYIYPFLELGLGLWYLTKLAPILAAYATIILMGSSSLGVIKALLQKREIRCACLGTVLNLPLSSITLVEDSTMVLMAIGMIAIG